MIAALLHKNKTLLECTTFFSVKSTGKRHGEQQSLASALHEGVRAWKKKNSPFFLPFFNHYGFGLPCMLFFSTILRHIHTVLKVPPGSWQGQAHFGICRWAAPLEQLGVAQMYLNNRFRGTAPPTSQFITCSSVSIYSSCNQTKLFSSSCHCLGFPKYFGLFKCFIQIFSLCVQKKSPDNWRFFMSLSWDYVLPPL